jgi:hypothetical protein
MPPPPSPAPSPVAQPFGAARWLLLLATAASFLLVFHNYGLDILPDRLVRISPAQIRPYSSEKTFAYVVDFDGSEADRWPSARSRVRFFEDAHAYSVRQHQTDEVILVGGDRFAHQPGRIVFSTVENTDPRTNGHAYSFLTPVLYSTAIGDTAMLVFLSCVVAWRFAPRGDRHLPAPPSGFSRANAHLAGATALFLIGLYCNTGTLAPYANTSTPLVVPTTGYAYNGDHIHFRVLFDFVDGRDRSVWDHAILLRRILFPVLGWPLMKLLGFEIGGTVTSLILNTAAFAAALFVLRRWIGERGAVFAGWIMALYPGAAYWAGLPYTYALIFPSSLLLMLALMRLAGPGGLRTVAAVSLAMGVAYLGYDLAITFMPASLIILCWRRRFIDAAVSLVLQAAPLAAWLFALGHVFHQPLQNGNTGIYLTVLGELAHPSAGGWWWQQALHAPGNGSDIFFAANFIFLPALFLVALALDPVTSRVRLHIAEVALLASGLALFAMLNLAPSDAGGWEMRGTWISRLYQPVFPALIVFTARWWQGLPALSRGCRVLVGISLAGATLGDALIVFGPILNDPWHISETAFYRFYDHTDAHTFYEQNLKDLGRRPLGFTRVIKGPTLEEMQAQLRGQLGAAQTSLEDIRRAVQENRAALRQVRMALRDVGLGTAEAKSELFARQLDRRRSRGEITADEAYALAKTPGDFEGPALKALLNDPSLDLKGPSGPIEPAPAVIGDLQAAIAKESKELGALEGAIGQAQNDLRAALPEQARAVDALARFGKGEAVPTPR